MDGDQMTAKDSEVFDRLLEAIARIIIDETGDEKAAEIVLDYKGKF